MTLERAQNNGHHIVNLIANDAPLVETASTGGAANGLAVGGLVFGGSICTSIKVPEGGEVDGFSVGPCTTTE